MERTQLGKYQLLERLGQGGMGEVWKGRDTQLQRYVAIKMLNADLQADPDFVTHFMREARLVASLRHPNIVQVHDFQYTSTLGSDIKAYMVMDYIEGGTLADFIRDTSRKGRFPSLADIVYLFAAISLALDYAHGTGMVHRDIKPANILLDRSIPGSRSMGEPILTDFGIARLQGQSSSNTLGSLVGTPNYISPEQAESHPIDARSDLYSLGIVLYEILTGVTPFRGDNPIMVMMRHVQEQPPSPALINPNISPALADVVLRSIAKEPHVRFSSAAAMTIALAQACDVPVPARLRGPEDGKVGSVYNPLQPLPGSLTPSSMAMSPTYPGHGMMTPTYLSPALNVQAMNVGHVPVIQTPSTQGGYSPQQLPAPERPPQRGRRRKRLLFASLVCVFLLLLGISTAFVLFSRTATSTPANANKVVGQITFVRDSNAAQGSFNQVQVDLTNIPSPQAGTLYYAWLSQNNSEAVILPHWQLQVVNGAVHHAFSYPAYPDLLTTSNRFLITTEDTNAPDIPNLDLSRRLYYAAISSTSSSSHMFVVKACPSGNIPNATNPCG